MNKTNDPLKMLNNAAKLGLQFVMLRHEDSVLNSISKNRGDIDLYVAASDFRELCKFLNTKSYFEIPGSHVFKNPFSNLVIDVHHGIYKRLPFLTERQLFSNARTILGLKYLSKEILFLVLFLHPLDITGIRGGRSYTEEKLRYLKKNRHLIKSTNIQNLLSQWLGPVCCAFLCRLALYDLKKVISATFIMKIFALCQSTKMRAYFFHRIKSKWTLGFGRKKPLIAVMGVDGSGKTTLIRGIQKFINESDGEGRCETLYLGSLGGYILPFEIVHKVYKYFSRKTKKNLIQESNLPHHNENLTMPKSKVASFGLGLFLALEYSVRWVILFWNVYICGRYVLLDRHFFDVSRQDVDHKILATIRYFFPNPAILIYLEGSADIFFKRKGEYSPAILNSHQKDTLTVLKRDYPGNLLVIDASNSQDIVLCDCLAELFGSQLVQD